MKRFFDLTLAVLFLPLILSLSILVSVIILLASGFPILYWSSRVGTCNIIFSMPKFRTMVMNTPAVATDQLSNPKSYLIPFGGLIRKLSLDELPQLWSILKGDMTFVGPRPALFNQYDLIEARTKHGIDVLKPGLTGWAQVNGRDELSIPEKVSYDYEYLQRQSMLFDIKIIWLTILRVLRSDGVAH